jgi:multidrug efflux pump subunit AcrB
MSRLITWFASNPVAANLLMVFVLVAGLAGISQIRQETYPNVAFDLISVAVPYPGAAPDEVEQAICVRVEEAIHGVKGIARLLSRASEGFGVVWARLEVGADPRRVLEEIRARVDAIDSFPDDAERPLIQELIDDSVLLALAVYGDADERTLRRAGERLRDEITALPEVARAELVGARSYELAIEVSEADLRRHGLRFDDVVRAVRASSLDLPGGTLKTQGGEILLRTHGRAYRASEFERLVLITRSDGARLALGQVARVVDGFVESDEKVSLDGSSAVVVRVLTSEQENVLTIAAAVKAQLERARAWLPQGLEADVWFDEAREFESRRDLLLRNGAQGLVLILAVLALFLRLRLAFWVSAGIPVAFLGALIVLAVTDVSINMMSLFAFIVALGLVVDDAIVVGENTARHQARGGDPLRGAIEGTREVAVPVTVAVLTTVFFAMPLLSLPTSVGKVARPMGVVVIACLVFSLLEALLILPAHLARSQERAHGRAGPLARLQRRVDAGVERFVARCYAPFVERCLRWPLLTLSVAAVGLMLSVALLAGGWVRYAFFPEIEADFVTARLVMPAGTPPEAVEAAAGRLEREVLALGEQLEAEAGGGRIFEHVMVAIGDAPYRHDDFNGGGDGPHVAHVHVGLVPGEARRVTSLEIEERWRERVGGIPGANALAFRGSDLTGEPALDVSLAGEDPARLRLAADALRSRLASLPGVREVSDSQSGGKQELRLAIRPEAEAFGLTLAELARQVRQGFHGEEVQRIQRGRDDVAVTVRYPREERRSLRDLESIRVRLPGGGELPFSAVAEARLAHGAAVVERRDRNSQIGVVADVDVGMTDVNVVIEELEVVILPEILAAFPGVSYDFFGTRREEAELTRHLQRHWALALIASYALLAVCLRSYLKPLLVFAAIPFGFVGGVAGHALLGIEFCAFSLIGLVALTGVVVNDALVLLDCANRLRARGRTTRLALLEAGVTRFRAIVLTSLTTFFGLLPLLFERSAQADWLEPMAATLGIGVVFASLITLVLVPASAALLEEGIGLAERLRRRPARDRTPRSRPRWRATDRAGRSAAPLAGG